MKRLAVIDGKSVFYRGYYAMPNLSTADGTPTGGVYGFAALSLELIKKLKPDYVAVAWDKPKTNIRKRLEIYPEYKAGRKPAPPDFYAQIPMLHQLLEAFGWPLYELDDYEADDIMATLADQASKQGIETCLITSDLDALQAIGPLTHVYALKKGFSQIEQFSPESFQEKYGLAVDQFLDLKALKGDSSDNIPGVPGVGEKTAVTLLQKYKTLDGIYENLWEINDSVRKRLETGKASAEISKKVAELWFDAPIKLDLESMDVTQLDAHELKKLLNQFEFKSLLHNLPDFMKTVDDAGDDEDLKPLEPATLIELDEKARVALTMAPAVVTVLSDDHLYISSESGTAHKVTLTEAATLLSDASIVAHGARPLLSALLGFGDDLPALHHDTEQGAFLLDPLRKTRDLGELVGSDVDDPLVAIQAVWSLYEEQGAELEKLPKLASVARNIDFPLLPVLVRMEHRGIVLDTDQLAVMQKELSTKITGIQEEMYTMVGYEFNIASPAQLAEVLFTKLQLSTIAIKKGKSGYSTAQSELDKLRGSHPIIELIEQYREYTKLQSTYVEALPKLVDTDSRLHTTYRQDVAATGRLSSNDPNLQNIPVRTEIGRKIREAFVPAKGNVFVSADYSQFELRLAAVLAGDQQMIEDFNSDIDIHAKTASDVYGIPLEQVTKSQRRDAKVINFGVLYGMSPHGLSAATGMSFHDAKVFIDNYFRLRAPIRRYIDNTIAKAKSDGYVETYFGRRRPTPDVKSSNFMVRAGAERAAANMPIQGTEADLMKMAMLEVEQRLNFELKNEKGNTKNDESQKNEVSSHISYSISPISPALGYQVLQIHDSILVECPAGNAEKVGELLKDTMETIYPELKIKLIVEVSIGKNWGEV
ncbi:DNA polymerase I [Candidatus Saccharibacteria bacterium]|nr:MAG: DNA polymerase I [Candidatus Saccharibacteria bacterium]